MAQRNPQRLAQAGPLDAVSGFPNWYGDANGLELELVAAPDVMAPAMGDLQTPALPVAFPTNYPEEAFYYMAEARLEVGGTGTVGRARVIMALEAAFGGDGTPEFGSKSAKPNQSKQFGVVFARLRVRIDDVIPGAKYVVRHPYGETEPLEADDGGRVFYTADTGIAEGNMARVLETGEIAPFLQWTGVPPAGYIGDGVTEHTVTGSAIRNFVEIAGPRIGQGSANAVGIDLVRTDLFTVQGRKRGTVPNQPVPGPPVFDVLSAEYRTSRAQYRIRGEIRPVTIPDPAGGFRSERVDVTLHGQVFSAFPDITGAWEIRHTFAGAPPPAPAPNADVVVTAASGPSRVRRLTVRN
ncbi:hypothetical protein [Novosphingobium sp. B 225]|uniref:hypothetical protein n=1 Tax=Novosphingobium sp. B 225 TaxID=1961849 RepID=UPI000B4AFF09|nr:hypothetical protein [Novosphingobium sp. B 225]